MPERRFIVEWLFGFFEFNRFFGLLRLGLRHSSNIGPVQLDPNLIRYLNGNCGVIHCRNLTMNSAAGDDPVAFLDTGNHLPMFLGLFLLRSD